MVLESLVPVSRGPDSEQSNLYNFSVFGLARHKFNIKGQAGKQFLAGYPGKKKEPVSTSSKQL
jgi:hypothetical protein